MTDPDQPPLRLTDRKRQDILRAAEEEFSARGFQATSMDRIAARARVSKRTLYNHFDGKDALFHEIVGVIVAKIETATAIEYWAHTPLVEQLTEIARREADVFLDAEMMALIRATLAEGLRQPELARAAFENLDPGGGGLVKWIKDAVADGRLDVPDPLLAAQEFTSLIKGSLFWPQLFAAKPAPEKAECRRVINSAIALFLGRYAG